MNPEELRKIAEEARRKDLEVANEKFFPKMVEAAKSGKTEIFIDAPTKIAGLFYSDEKQEVFAKYLMKKGFRCEKKSEILDGVRQDPAWFLIF